MDIKARRCTICGLSFPDDQYFDTHVCISKPKITLDQVANQEHYTQFEIQPMEYCQRNKLGWCASNVVKYVSRENKKDGIKDLYKAMDYLRCLIHWRESGTFLTPDKLEKNHEKQ